jgi:hypothetical protein
MKRFVLACLLALPGASLHPAALPAQQRDIPRRDTTAGGVHSLPRDVAQEVTDLYNAPATLRVNGRLDVAPEREIVGDVAVLNGPVTVSGRITGRLVAINADVTLRPSARIDGDVIIVGGVVDGRHDAYLGGELRIYRQVLSYREEGERIVAERDVEVDGPWWRFRRRQQPKSVSNLTLFSARTYNRVEGLPIYFGPSLEHDLGWGRFSLDALGIFRTADNFHWDSENLGHNVMTELRVGRGQGLRIGARLYDEVAAVEEWQLSGSEVGLATFFLHRDYRDYFNRHGGTAYVGLYANAETDLTLSLSDQRWASRDQRDPFTLFRNGDRWRENPSVDEGRFHVANATLRIDTRNDENDPWAGWFVVADYERGQGEVTSFGETSFSAISALPRGPGARDETPGRREYGRGFLDLRRYNRVSPNGQVNGRVVLGGWLHGDPLPLQRRFSVSGPGSLPGFDFRRTFGGDDVGQCSVATAAGSQPRGAPAQCERMALAQLEYRGDLHLSLFGSDSDDEDRPWRRYGWRTDAAWVAFVDAGRGWLVGERTGDLVYPRDAMPRLGTFRTDIGVGLDFGSAGDTDFGGLGIYIAKSVSEARQPANFFVRVRRRF